LVESEKRMVLRGIFGTYKEKVRGGSEGIFGLKREKVRGGCCRGEYFRPNTEEVIGGRC